MDRGPMYSMYPQGGRGPYSGPARGGYYGMGHMDMRRGAQMPMQMDQGPPRYDPYRRPDFYDPYMMQRGGNGAGMPPNYYHHSTKIGGSGGNNSSSGANSSSSHSRNQTAQPPVRYSNPYNRR